MPCGDDDDTGCSSQDQASLGDLIDEFSDQEDLYRTENREGVENLCRIVRAIGYKDPQHMGQFHYNGAIGDLITFLEDNPGAIIALRDWIAEQDIPEWKEKITTFLIEKSVCEICGEQDCSCD
jgi:hypothetical protein